MKSAGLRVNRSRGGVTAYRGARSISAPNYLDQVVGWERRV
jgi:hypothetical protein